MECLKIPMMPFSGIDTFSLNVDGVEIGMEEVECTESQKEDLKTC